MNKTDQANKDENVTGNSDKVPEDNTRYPTRIRNKPSHLKGYVIEDDEENNVNYTDYCYRVANIPTMYNEAVDSLEVSKWRKGHGRRNNSLNDNDTYNLVTLPEDRQIVGENGSMP